MTLSDDQFNKALETFQEFGPRHRSYCNLNEPKGDEAKAMEAPDQLEQTPLVPTAFTQGPATRITQIPEPVFFALEAEVDWHFLRFTTTTRDWASFFLYVGGDRALSVRFPRCRR